MRRDEKFILLVAAASAFWFFADKVHLNASGHIAETRTEYAKECLLTESAGIEQETGDIFFVGCGGFL
jgi:hypothetical protein